MSSCESKEEEVMGEGIVGNRGNGTTGLPVYHVLSVYSIRHQLPINKYVGHPYC